jgi:hypothetical protein
MDREMTIAQNDVRNATKTQVPPIVQDARLTFVSKILKIIIIN